MAARNGTLRVGGRRKKKTGRTEEARPAQFLEIVRFNTLRATRAWSQNGPIP